MKAKDWLLLLTFFVILEVILEGFFDLNFKVKNMSGHSKWATTKHQKFAADAKRSANFTKLAKMITVAARDGGGDPTANFKLRLAVEKAKSFNMPKDNIERAIKNGTGELSGNNIETVIYEAFGQGGSGLIIEGLTDNKNRAVAEVKRILSKGGANFAGGNSVLWMFERKGVISISNENLKGDRDELELKIIELGAEDIVIEDEGWTIYLSVENLQGFKEGLDKLGISPESAEMELVAKEKIKLPDEESRTKLENLIEALEECDDVDNVYTNVDW